MAERPSTCDPHTETLRVYLYSSAGASFMGDRQESRLNENGGDGSSGDQAMFRWPPRSPNLMPCDLKIMAIC